MSNKYILNNIERNFEMSNKYLLNTTFNENLKSQIMVSLSRIINFL